MKFGPLLCHMCSLLRELFLGVSTPLAQRMVQEARHVNRILANGVVVACGAHTQSTCTSDNLDAHNTVATSFQHVWRSPPKKVLPRGLSGSLPILPPVRTNDILIEALQLEPSTDHRELYFKYDTPIPACFLRAVA